MNASPASPPPTSSAVVPAPGASADGRLSALADLLVDEPALTAVLGRANALLAVPEPARAVVIAGLARRTERQPLVVAVPTAADAERLAHDLGAFLGADEVELFPAWETLPFERVSPSVETMGRRLRVLWHLRNGVASPPATAVEVLRGWSSPRCGRWSSASGPTSRTSSRSWSATATGSTRTSWWPSSWPSGYRREDQVEHRGEVAVRGSIVDVFPSTADAPVRIDLWGDEVDRLTEFSVDDQRSTTRPRRGRALPGAGSCCPPTRCGPGPRSWWPPSRGVASSGSAWPRA